MDHSTTNDFIQLRLHIYVWELSQYNFVNGSRVQVAVVLMQEQEQVNMGKAALLILKLVAVGHVTAKNVLVPEIIDQSVNL
jgi:hypothetical protein